MFVSLLDEVAGGMTMDHRFFSDKLHVSGEFQLDTWQADYVQEDCFSLPPPGTEKEPGRWTPLCVHVLP